MLKEINIRDLKKSPVEMIADDWALLTSGDISDWNTMTVSWGMVGELWGKDVAACFVRPQRYTYGYMERNDLFTLSFFDGEYKKELGICGAKSGRDTDKAKETGFVPIAAGGAVTFEQAKAVIVLKKIAVSDMDPDGFLDESIMKNYPNNDFHKIFVGNIEKVYINE